MENVNYFEKRKEVEREILRELAELRRIISGNVKTGDLIELPGDCILKIGNSNDGLNVIFIGDKGSNEFIRFKNLSLTQHQRYITVLLENKNDIIKRINKMNENAVNLGENLLKTNKTRT